MQEETTAIRGKPSIGAATTGQISPGPTTDDPCHGGTKTNAEHHHRSTNVTGQRPPMQSLSAQAFNTLPAAELDDLTRRRQPGLDQTRPYTRGQSPAQDSKVWRDQLLAEIEALASELQGKVAGFALFCALHSSGEASVLDDAVAVEWMQGTLEDLAATALGIEMA